MYKRPINGLVEDLKVLESEMSVEYAGPSPSLVFSNTGRRGQKFFSITLKQLVEVLTDMKLGFSDFSSCSAYEETPWRNNFSKWISNPVVNALSTVQTLPLYALINKVIHVANGLSVSSYREKQMALTTQTLDVAISYLAAESSRYLEPEVSDQDVISDWMVSSQSASYQVKVGCNVIYYGAPGTGKSYSIDKIVSDSPSIKTVFHPDTQYSDFVGALKPVMSRTSGTTAVGYEFRPGPFIKAFVLAKANPSIPVYLVIEEINRASAAAVFGELFQLLDRKPDGGSQYSIDIADPDMLAYINNELVTRTGSALQHDRLDIPSNLSIFATMNSSDQAVMPMDTAFKRRWQFVYLPISYSEATKGEMLVNTSRGSIRVSWAVFAEVINSLLIEEQISEDRLLGHRFLATHELHSDQHSSDALKGKLLMYLWDDVLRHRNRELIFSTLIDGKVVNTFGQLASAFDNGKPVFSNVVEDALILRSDRNNQDGTVQESDVPFMEEENAAR